MWLELNCFSPYPPVVGCIYIPPNSSPYYNEDQILILQNEITEMHTKHKLILLAGDFNAHTGTSKDFILNDPLLANFLNFDGDAIVYLDAVNSLKSNKYFSLHRKSVDNKVNPVGKKLLDLCKNNNLLILNGRSSIDKKYRSINI